MRQISCSRRKTSVLVAGLLGAAVIFPPTVVAAPEQTVSQCSRPILGELSCQAGVRCVCRYVRESAMTDSPGGYQWDCGIKRPACELPPADLERWTGPYPSSIGIDRTTIYDYPDRLPR